MGKNALVSVIIPTYNREDSIEQSVRSVMNQTYRNLEIIVVDDGSTDGTAIVVDRLTEEDSRIRYIVNTSDIHGPSAARNFGINAALGKYIAFNDSDDQFREKKIQSQLQQLLDDDADINFCVKKKGEALSPWKGFASKDITVETILHRCFSGTQSILGKADVIKSELFDENMNCNEDWELLIRLTEKYKISFTNEVLVDVDNTEGSVGSSAKRGALMMEYIVSKHDKLYQKCPYAKKKMLSQIKYANAVVKDEEKSSLLTKIERYMALVSAMR